MTGGTLYVVATPIGNLGDVTLRSLEVLRAVGVVAAEDTRLTRRLFARHGIATPLTSFHARNARARLPDLLGRLRGGQDVADKRLFGLAFYHQVNLHATHGQAPRR